MRQSVPRAAAAVCLLTSLLLARPGSAEDTITRPLSEVPLNYGRMGVTGPATFDIAMNVGTLGFRDAISFTAEATMQTTVSGSTVRLQDTWDILGRLIRVDLSCERAPLLPLRQYAVEATRKEQRATATLTVENGVATVEAEGTKQEIPYPPATLMQAAVFRIVPLLPRDAGITYTFEHYTDTVEIRPRAREEDGPFGITCVGPEGVPIGGETVRCTKYVLDVDRPLELYVDATGRLRVIVADEGTTLMVRRDDRVSNGAGNAR